MRKGIVLATLAAAVGVILAAVPRGVRRPPAGLLPADLSLGGAAVWGYLGDANRDLTADGVTLDSSRPAANVTRTVVGLDARSHPWYRFAVRGLPQRDFAVPPGGLEMRVAFFGNNGKTAYDAKGRPIDDQIAQARRDLSVNGNHGRGGAEVWRTYTLDFVLPFPQVDTVKLSVGFDHGAAGSSAEAAFLVESMTLTPITDPANVPTPATRPAAVTPTGTLIPLGGRWFYAATDGQAKPPATFDATNVDRLLYKDAVYSAPFAGNATAVMRAGFKEADGSVVTKDRPLNDSVTVRFDGTSMIVHSHGVPNHPTGRFPEGGFGNRGYVKDTPRTYYFPLEPKENPAHRTTDTGNRNGALHMGPIGLAVNGVVFFNPFDMGNQDATDLMDRCCGHPSPDDQYHYHKYPICVNSPWSDEGTGHSALLGWAFDGYPLYGPYESRDVMAKDVTGEHALNAFNMHYDAERGWHYHVTPGRFPYLIGGFWGVEDRRNADRHGPPGGRRGPPPGGPPPGGMPPDGPAAALNRIRSKNAIEARPASAGLGSVASRQAR